MKMMLQFFGGRGASRSGGSGGSTTGGRGTMNNTQVMNNISSGIRTGNSSLISETLSDLNNGDTITLKNRTFDKQGVSVADYKTDITSNGDSFRVTRSVNGKVTSSGNLNLGDAVSTVVNFKTETGNQNNMTYSINRKRK